MLNNSKNAAWTRQYRHNPTRLPSDYPKRKEKIVQHLADLKISNHLHCWDTKRPHPQLCHRINTSRYLCNRDNGCRRDCRIGSYRCPWQTWFWLVRSDSMWMLEKFYPCDWTLSLYYRRQRKFYQELHLKREENQNWTIWKNPIHKCFMLDSWNFYQAFHSIESIEFSLRAMF